MYGRQTSTSIARGMGIGMFNLGPTMGAYGEYGSHDVVDTGDGI